MSRSTISAHDRENGSLLIEALISIAIIAIAATTITWAVSSVSQKQSRSKTQISQNSIAQSVLERLRSDRSWSQNATPGTPIAICPGTPCPIPATSSQLVDSVRTDENGDPIRYSLDVTATGRDTDHRTPDPDGQQVDIFDVDVTVRENIAGNMASTIPPLTLNTRISTLGLKSMGTVSIAFCIGQQMDARKAVAIVLDANGVANCTNPTANQPINKNTTCMDRLAPGEPTGLDCRAIDAALQDWTMFPNGAWRSDIDLDARITRLPGGANLVPFRLLDSHGTVTPPWGQPAFTLPAGSNVWDSRDTNLHFQPGTYRIIDGNQACFGAQPGLSPCGTAPDLDMYRIWTAGSVPAGNFVTIRAGAHSNSVQIFQRLGTIRLFLETVDVSNPWNVGQPVAGIQADNLYASLIPAPAGRTEQATRTDLDTRIPINQPFVDLTNLPAGPYITRLALRTPTQMLQPIAYPQLRAVNTNATSEYIAGCAAPVGLNACANQYRALPGYPGEVIWLAPAAGWNQPGCIANPIGAACRNQPQSIKLRLERCDPAARNQLITVWCTPLGLTSCWGEQKLHPNDPDSQLVKKFLKPCSGLSAAGISLGSGGT